MRDRGDDPARPAARSVATPHGCGCDSGFLPECCRWFAGVLPLVGRCEFERLAATVACESTDSLTAGSSAALRWPACCGGEFERLAVVVACEFERLAAGCGGEFERLAAAASVGGWWVGVGTGGGECWRLAVATYCSFLFCPYHLIRSKRMVLTFARVFDFALCEASGAVLCAGCL